MSQIYIPANTSPNYLHDPSPGLAGLVHAHPQGTPQQQGLRQATDGCRAGCQQRRALGARVAW